MKTSDQAMPSRVEAITAYFLFAALCLVWAAFPSQTWHVLSRFLTGFVRFLARNIPAMSPNAATWVPGVVAFAIATAVLHRLLAGPLRRRLGTWRVSHTISLAMVLPVLFIIAFIVPGIILHAVPLAMEPWFEWRGE